MALLAKTVWRNARRREATFVHVIHSLTKRSSEGQPAHTASKDRLAKTPQTKSVVGLRRGSIERKGSPDSYTPPKRAKQSRIPKNILRGSISEKSKNDREHPSETKIFTMKMEILLEPTSNKLLNHLKMEMEMEFPVTEMSSQSPNAKTRPTLVMKLRKIS
ncbi:hypothetical protein Tco_0519968 [Tanacetum coccineum]